MARGKKRITTQPGYVTYLRTSNEDAQAPERSQNGQRRDIQQLMADHLTARYGADVVTRVAHILPDAPLPERRVERVS